MAPRDGACWDPTAEPHRTTPGKGEGKNKNRKDGRKTKTKTQTGTILWKSMKWDRRQVYDGDTAHGASQEMSYTQLGTEYFN